MNIKNYLWLLPFCCFLLGYIAARLVFSTTTIQTPHLIGMPVHQALSLTSQRTLHIQIIDQKEETAIPEGIIISQIPQSGKLIKSHQSIYVVTTTKPLTNCTPCCLKKHINDFIQPLELKKIYPKIYQLTHSYKAGTCIAQSPQSEEPLEHNKLILYISSGNSRPVLWPQCIGLSFEKTMAFLDELGIKPYIINDSPILNKPMSEYTVIDQRPVAGTLVTIDDKNVLSVQLRIQ